MASRKTPAKAAKSIPTPAASKTPTQYQFSFGPWNISTGADPFGPPVRKEMEYAQKLKTYKELGFDAVQFHDDDIVPADLDWPSTRKGVAAVKSILDGEGPVRRDRRARGSGKIRARSTAAFTSNNPGDRKYAIDRAQPLRRHRPARSAARITSSGWPAKEPTSAKPSAPRRAIARIVEAWNAILEHDSEIRVLGEAKPNEPMDQAYLPTVGHMVGVAY